MLQNLLSGMGLFAAPATPQEKLGSHPQTSPSAAPQSPSPRSRISVKVVGVGGAGGNAVARMRDKGIREVDLLALNTDAQALAGLTGVAAHPIGGNAVNGMGSGGRPDAGRRAAKESRQSLAALLDGADMVFITAGMGGGTGTGASPIVAEIAKKKGALTVGVVTLPFSFEGARRRAVAEEGLNALRQKVDTLIAVENDRLLPSLKGKISLRTAFETADETLRQGVKGISEIITVPGMINVDFADVRAVMDSGGAAFMARGEGKGKWAALEAARSALANPLFNAPIQGASGVLFNVRGGYDLTLGQVHEVAEIIRKATKSDANVIFGVAQDKRMKRRVSITLVGTGVGGPTTAQPPQPSQPAHAPDDESATGVTLTDADLADLMRPASTPTPNGNHPNGLTRAALSQTTKLV